MIRQSYNINKGENVMTNKVINLKGKTKQVSKEQKTTLLNYGMFKESIKEYTKQKDLLRPECVEIFKQANTNLILLTKMNNGFEGYAQLIERTAKRFDTATFKEQYPELYKKFLVSSESVEIKVNYNGTGGESA